LLLAFLIWVLAASFLAGTETANISVASNSAVKEAIDHQMADSISSSLASKDPPIQILPLGDSITQSNSVHLSYRYALWNELIDAEIDFDFVGTQSSNRNGNPPWPEYKGYVFDRDHEGHSAWRAEQILEELPEWLEGYTPAIVLLHIGTNDAFANQPIPSTVKEIKQIISVLRDDNPEVIILLAQVLPVRDPVSNKWINELNEKIDKIGESESTEESPVVIVDQNSEFDVSEDTYDGIHPDESGEEKMAQKWFDAIIDSLPESNGS
jgi:lysophospholipase L1-like esterase